MSGLPEWNDATRAQITAARPDMSTWLSANAGSGKTRVLTDRVARLLLESVKPQHILCLTYTKAAASEMQNRLFKRLGEWAMMEDDSLREGLRDLGILKEVSSEQLREARTLFAQAIETPGGLKIQTIHSFCASLLRRFPLEAGVSPQFKEIEDRAAELLRAEILDTMAEGQDAALVADLADHYTGESFASLTQSITSNRELFVDLPQDLNKLFDLPENFDISNLPRDIMDEAVARWMPDAITVLSAQSTKTMIALADKLRGINFDEPSIADLNKLKSAMLTKEMQPRKNFPTKGAQTDLGKLLTPFEDLAQRTFESHDLQMRARNVARTGALHRFASVFIGRYEAEKQRRGWLDFDDLILRARALLNDPKVAAWVLYRIDGGIDHILVDEAQDTSPRQWDVIEKLADEFASGEGAREDEMARTLFVVGDKKQSIYSFQGADPREFDLKREAFQESLEAANMRFQNQSLDYSFRSSPAVLRVVDRTFNTLPDPRMDEPMTHLAFKDALPGRVDLWPVVDLPKDESTKPDWTDPIDSKNKQPNTVVLAEQIAEQIKHLIEGEHYIPDEAKDRSMVRRRITAGDFLILVRGRMTGLFSEIIRACKAAGLPIAGADRLKVGAELAVRDIGALLSFLATPDDALSLATALRSPLFGWDEQALFTLSHHRPLKQDLWQYLRTQEDRYPETLDTLHDLRSQVDFLRPYDLIERILTRHDGRKNLLSRLGTEAEDGVDALLGQALAYERTEVPSLTGFLEWMQADDLEIKRQIDSASDQIRVMTVHGAKGLEAPIVILPDTGTKKNDIRDDIIKMDGVPIWKPNAAEMTDGITAEIDALKDAQTQEGLRLLYVAMTRAEKWLIVAAADALPKDGNSWYQMTEEALGHLNAVPFNDGPADGMRHEEAGWDDLPVVEIERSETKEAVLETVFSTNPPPAPVKQVVLSPSIDLGGAKALAGEAGMDEEAAKAYGSLVHMLLENLASVDPALWDAASEQLLNHIDPALAATAVEEAKTVLENPDLAHVFHSDTLAEVAITAELGEQRLYGVIDRLIVADDYILAVDFKTNRTVPKTANDCPEGLLRQMGAYAHALQAVYPNHRIETAILWTQTGSLMSLPHETVTSALERTGYLDADDTSS
ncbi:double-strand break repair helicase AddA [Sulfitobacter donghicola]|uniref:DNA 3'-5' helicase n=1 Tax=Sulfitobacter donghicola DSW-25 = KCTC 12864 = JCM 14565 TaxID=1300350 RepID=A0A073IMA9_9RHOB|nr:double-strand break repair helicase AddA [Sulfitobacter donghicola]KEJ90631.1 helicase UvrD [Sulfitobacter donghicola DSW-25 = KCTC 12864 = JCM 14565]KIN67880.1 ATP-dependent DNA helicase, UvrD/Rep family protein [Sulfitobacter donghicola DSW-25 = KCTC 12864 = JCM 14565]